MHAATGTRSSTVRVPASPWRRALMSVRSPLGLSVVGATVGLGLLLAFQQTVAGSVERGDQQRKASLAQRNSAWRCNLLPDRNDRAVCQVQAIAAQGASK